MTVLIVRFIFILLGAVGGSELFNWLRVTYLPSTSLFFEFLSVLAGVLVGGGLGYVFGGVVGRALERIFYWLKETIQKVPAGDLLIGVIGLAIGLVIAFLFSLGLRLIPYGAYFSVIVFIFLGGLGFYTGILKREEIAGIFRFGRRTTARSFNQEALAKIIDTSSIIDGRIADIFKTGFIEGSLILPRFVLDEIHMIADSSDTLKRNRGRRGLDILSMLQKEKGSHIEIYDADFPDITGVDAKLIRLAKQIGGAIITVDYNLNKIAKLQGVKVLNVNELANAIKTVVLPGEELKVRIVREGKERNQGVGYLDDGTMIVVEEGRKHIGEDVNAIVTSILQTPAGRMIFTKLKE